MKEFSAFYLIRFLVIISHELNTVHENSRVPCRPKLGTSSRGFFHIQILFTFIFYHEMLSDKCKGKEEKQVLPPAFCLPALGKDTCQFLKLTCGELPLTLHRISIH